MQITERAIAGAKIVNADLRPELLELFQHRRDFRGIIHDHTVGNFKLEASG